VALSLITLLAGYWLAGLGVKVLAGWLLVSLAIGFGLSVALHGKARDSTIFLGTLAGIGVLLWSMISSQSADCADDDSDCAAAAHQLPR
jgi:hypothetical protein